MVVFIELEGLYISYSQLSLFLREASLVFNFRLLYMWSLNSAVTEFSPSSGSNFPISFPTFIFVTKLSRFRTNKSWNIYNQLHKLSCLTNVPFINRSTRKFRSLRKKRPLRVNILIKHASDETCPLNLVPNERCHLISRRPKLRPKRLRRRCTQQPRLNKYEKGSALVNARFVTDSGMLRRLV